jgi:hypothetical protein
MRDFRLPPQCRWDMRSSGTLRSAEWQFCTDVSGQPMDWDREVVLKRRYGTIIRLCVISQDKRRSHVVWSHVNVCSNVNKSKCKNKCYLQRKLPTAMIGNAFLLRTSIYARSARSKLFYLSWQILTWNSAFYITMAKRVPNGKLSSVLATTWHEVITGIWIDGSWDLASELGVRVVVVVEVEQSFIEFHLSPCFSPTDQLDLPCEAKERYGSVEMKWQRLVHNKTMSLSK